MFNEKKTCVWGGIYGGFCFQLDPNIDVYIIYLELHKIFPIYIYIRVYTFFVGAGRSIYFFCYDKYVYIRTMYLARL